MGWRSQGSVFRVFGPSEVDIIWDIWGSYYNMPKAVFYLRKAGLHFILRFRASGTSWIFRVVCPKL